MDQRIMMPFISIIIPVYNVAPYLRECLDSVLAQTFTDWEAICVDDGSTDGSSAILDEYAAKDKRFHVIHQSNAGVSAARNKALDIIRGEWISFLDADDLLAKNALTKLIGVAKSSDADLAIGGVLYFGGKAGDVFIGPQAEGLFSPEDLYIEYNSLCAWSWGKIYKRTLWDKIRFPEGVAYSEDRYVLHKILYAYPKVPFAAGALYRYRARSDSAYGSSWKPNMVQKRFALEKQMAFFREKGFTRAELFTAGLYFKWISYDICKLAEMDQINKDLLEKVRSEFRRTDAEYWEKFAKAALQEHWNTFPSCGVLRTCMDMAYSRNGNVMFARRFWNVLRYDGVGFACRKMISKVSW